MSCEFFIIQLALLLCLEREHNSHEVSDLQREELLTDPSLTAVNFLCHSACLLVSEVSSLNDAPNPCIHIKTEL